MLGKFRVWDVNRKQFDKGCFDIDQDGTLSDSLAEWALNKDEWIPSFYTTLNDSDGKEIYEGDELEIIFKRMGGNRIVKYIVKFDCGQFLACNPICCDDKGALYEYLSENESVKLTGKNIYQNPEILNAR